ncbi:DUF3515 family protein [Demequina oxidasica]|uniref:DUF3515 family protein n=1 Tax=Demequina oxidasica TaxID=676199 RepID=UPI000785FA42|nr:DUF3515 family protein [Demequina oxidasica]
MLRARFAALAVLSAIALAGCTQPLIVAPALYAADPDCADVMLSVPDTLGGLDVHATSSQATSSWGDDYPIVARCGVEPPGPTSESCTEVKTPSVTMGWLIEEDGDDWLAVTFGHSPALEMRVPKVRADAAVADVLAEVSDAAALAPTNGLECR